MITVRGTAQVQWKPAYTLVLASADGASLDADGKVHTLTATLTHTVGGSAVSGRIVQLTTSPRARTGDGARGFTDGSGVVRFTVSDSNDEDVVYTATLKPQGAITGTTTITWGTVGLIQSAIQAYTQGPLTGSIVLGQDVGVGRLLACFVASQSNTTGVRVTPAGLGAYTLAGSSHQWTDFGLFNNMALYYRVATGAGEKTVNFTVADAGTSFDACVLEYGGYDHTAPLDGTNGNANGVGAPSAWTANSVPVSAAGGLVLAGFMAVNVDDTGFLVATNGYSIVKKIEYGGGEPSPSDVDLWVISKSGLSAASTPTMTDGPPGDPYAAAAASFLKPT